MPLLLICLNMKILIVSQYFYPENFRINDVVKELINRGHKVTIVTGLPNYPEGNIYNGYELSYKKPEYFYGAVVFRCKLRPRKRGTINLALNYISFIIQAKKVLKRIKPDFEVIYFYEPSPITSGIPAIWYGKKHKIKTIMYNLDIWPDCVRDSRNGKVMSKANPVFLFSKIVSKYVYKNIDFVLNKCDEFGDYLNTELNVSFNKMATLLEHAEDIYLNVKSKPIENGIVDFMFLGNIGKTQNCDQMVLAFSKINDPNIRFHFVGDGSYLQSLKKLVDDLFLKDKVFFYGRKSLEETIDYYNFADVCVLALSNQTTSGLTPPTKLAGYLAASRPVVASLNGAGRKIVESAHCGFACDADDVFGFQMAMENAIDNLENLETLGKNGRTFFLQNFTLQSHIDLLEKYFLRIINSHE